MLVAGQKLNLLQLKTQVAEAEVLAALVLQLQIIRVLLV
jgi:hypothetical protein